MGMTNPFNEKLELHSPQYTVKAGKKFIPLANFALTERDFWHCSIVLT